MKFVLTTLTPIHIGNGNQISNWSYAVSGNKISIYNFDKVVRDLVLQKNKDILKVLSREIENEALTKTLGEFLQDKGLTTKPSYKCNLYADLEYDNKKTGKKEYKQIWEFIKERGEAYIPGTEIKGAIRTALFYYLLSKKIQQEQQFKDRFLKIFSETLKKVSLFDENSEGYKRCKNNKQVENCIKKQFQEKVVKEIKDLEKELFLNGESDIHYDFMKFFLVGDAFYKDENGEANEKSPPEVNEHFLAIVDVLVVGSRKRKTLHEIIESDKDFSGSINFPEPNKIKFLEKNGYPNITVLSVEEISTACNTFSENLVNAEIEDLKRIVKKEKGFKERKTEEAIRKLEEIKKELEELKDGEFIIRLGKHEGFLSTTINLLLRNLDKDLYSKIYPHLVPKGYAEEPNKTRKITSRGETLGWCKLKIQIEEEKSSKDEKSEIKGKTNPPQNREDLMDMLREKWGARIRK